MLQYHGTEVEAEVMEKTGIYLFRSASKENIDGLNLLQMVAEFDSDEIVNGNLAFVEEYRKIYNRLPLFEVMKGHNHISNTLAIGLPDDFVGKRILAFAIE